ncbi:MULTISPECIES: phosphatase PAP2 family protein [Prauserella salsuginis group]|uniref:Phosphatase PAP2 family protein n=1 Tax=Prauserella salsuginis TaxID=387889 RepID=A0ABW6G5L5_9PSEU|nr:MULTISPECIES: phosphatase PAP2 family protein [Prauserella salsuginis group]MCR3719096.1 undecaprenyl-diphosphatase [Prauserella flava]MCR3733666.1 undecaprenyl-diphosphatase [Prauserella salsuginis]
MPGPPTSTRRPHPGTGRTRLTSTGLALLVLFTALGLVARDGTGVDRALTEGLHGVWRTTAGDVAAVVGMVLGPVLPLLLAAALVVAALRYRRSDPYLAGLLVRVLVVLGACRMVSAVAKPLFARDRPRQFPDWAFPSGHVTSVAATGFAVWLLTAWVAPQLRRRAAATAGVAVAVCAASRIVLEVHWLTDTVGAVVGVAGAGLVTTVALRLTPVPPRRPGVESAP